MEAAQVEKDRTKRSWGFYLISGISILVTASVIAAAIYFREELQLVWGYGYAGVFLIGLLCGITIIPVPTLLMVFGLGGVLNPLYVGLIAGFGGAVGGITVYLTGAGVGTIFSRFAPQGRTFGYQPGKNCSTERPRWYKFWSRGQAYYNRLVEWVGGKGGSWTIFITSAMIISPYYFAGLAAGSLHMGLLRFFLISWAGKTVRYLIVAFAGYWGLQFILKWIGG